MLSTSDGREEVGGLDVGRAGEELKGQQRFPEGLN